MDRKSACPHKAANFIEAVFARVGAVSGQARRQSSPYNAKKDRIQYRAILAVKRAVDENILLKQGARLLVLLGVTPMRFMLLNATVFAVDEKIGPLVFCNSPRCNYCFSLRVIDAR
jgi:hypothetical protein